MDFNLYCYYDRKANYYKPPFLDNLPVEAFKEMVRRSTISASPEVKARMCDCDIYRIGVFDDVTGAMDTLDKPEFIVSLDDFCKLGT